MVWPTRHHHLILDGYNLIHRARGGFQKGDWPIVFNFFRGLRPLVEKFLPSDDVTIILEGTPKRQEAVLPTYKGTRGPAPDGFERQKDAIIEILKMMPVTLRWHPDFEADDVIHNLLTRLDLHTDSCTFVSVDATVVSSDSDFTQLLQRDLRPEATRGLIRGSWGRTGSEHITVWNWRTEQNLVRPDYDYVRWKALRGDPTDNIPKCPGMTDKTALEVVKDDNRFALLMRDPAFQMAYERNLGLVRLEDMTHEEWDSCIYHDGNYRGPPELKKIDDPKLAESFPNGMMEIRHHTPIDWDAVKTKFESFGFRSMLKDSTWQKWTDTFDRIGKFT